MMLLRVCDREFELKARKRIGLEVKLVYTIGEDIIVLGCSRGATFRSLER